MCCNNKYHMRLSVTETLQGKDGTDGKSAYQVALDNGFVGSEQDWLASLKGDKGDPGTTDYNELENKPTKLTDFSGILPISQGGTGAITVSEALTNLSAQHILTAGSNITIENNTISSEDTELKNRVTTLENTVGTLNDSLEEILNGN